MLRIQKSPQSETDLENIWLYSFETWDEAQADRYYDALAKGINQLASNPEIGRSRDDIREGYRSIQINRHIVFYRIEGQAIDVVRVLHERMDPENHL